MFFGGNVLICPASLIKIMTHLSQLSNIKFYDLAKYCVICISVAYYAEVSITCNNMGDVFLYILYFVSL